MPIFTDPITVELVPHRAWDDNATIPGWVDHNQYLVYVHCEGLAYRNKDKKLQVGIIGKQPGANFCPTNELNGFTYPHQVWIAEEAKRLHGSANPAPHVNLPPHEDVERVEDDGDTSETEE